MTFNGALCCEGKVIEKMKMPVIVLGFHRCFTLVLQCSYVETPHPTKIIPFQLDHCALGK